MKALVTGAGGFLGLYLVEQLVARGDRVRTLSRGHYVQLERLGVEARQADLRDAQAVDEACRGVDIVFHAAGVAGIWGPWRHFYSINTLGTQHVVDACRKQGVRQLVYTSSPSVTFAGRDQCGVDESVPYPGHWLAHYPHSKALAEQIVLNANSNELLTCALRPHLIWGPRDQHLIPRLLERARQGKLLRVGDGKNLVDITYVENAAAAHLQAAEALTHNSPVAGQAYFISQGEPVNCWNWIDQVLELAGLPPVRKSISAPTARRIGMAMELLYSLFRRKAEPRMTRFLAAQLSTHHYFDIRGAQNDFGYRPAISTEEGMCRLAAAWKQPAEEGRLSKHV